MRGVWQLRNSGVGRQRDVADRYKLGDFLMHDMHVRVPAEPMSTTNQWDKIRTISIG